MNALLITSDEKKFNIFKSTFNNNFVGLKLIISADAKRAINIISEEGNIAFIAVDVDFEENIAEVLNAIIDISGNRPIIICGTEDDLAKINKGLIFKNEANCVLKEITNPEKIKVVISSAINWTKKSQNINEDDEISESELENKEYVCMKLRNLYLYSTFPNDLFVKISDKKYVLAIEKDTEIREFEISKLVKRKIKNVYIEKDKHLEFLTSSMKSAQLFFTTNQNLNKKVIMAHLRSTALLQDYLVNLGHTTELNIFIDNFLDHLILVLDKELKFSNIFEYYQYKLESNISRSLLCAYVCFYLLKELGWKSTTVRKKFLFASLIQDTFVQNDALSRIASLTDSKIIEFSEEEIKSYPEHPKLIAEIARQFTQFPDLDFLLEQHHELPTRDGFPKRPPASELQLAVCIFNLSSNFAKEIDGQEANLQNFQQVFKLSFAKNFNLGNFKDPNIRLKKILELD